MREHSRSAVLHKDFIFLKLVSYTHTLSLFITFFPRDQKKSLKSYFCCKFQNFQEGNVNVRSRKSEEVTCRGFRKTGNLEKLRNLPPRCFCETPAPCLVECSSCDANASTDPNIFWRRQLWMPVFSPLFKARWNAGMIAVKMNWRRSLHANETLSESWMHGCNCQRRQGCHSVSYRFDQNHNPTNELTMIQ